MIVSSNSVNPSIKSFLEKLVFPALKTLLHTTYICTTTLTLYIVVHKFRSRTRIGSWLDINVTIFGNFDQLSAK
jgi:hypothetical protein